MGTAIYVPGLRIDTAGKKLVLDPPAKAPKPKSGAQREADRLMAQARSGREKS
jgi:hypothetical protein